MDNKPKNTVTISIEKSILEEWVEKYQENHFENDMASLTPSERLDIYQKLVAFCQPKPDDKDLEIKKL